MGAATPARSAGLLLFRRTERGLEVLLGHLGGPYFAKRDAGAWSIPKGEYGPDEESLAAARREFTEEFGSAPPAGELVELGTVRQRNGKLVTAWAVEADFDAEGVVSNTFEIEWPPRSGRRQSFPEIDRAGWFDLVTARGKMIAGQDSLIDRLLERIAGAPT
ncbi:MAG TPA: NUDIX domain-containing protein [Jatrophihabitans sp.]|nr:NUDIX domain-containing protein [Jatrophihabitans sp.]